MVFDRLSRLRDLKRIRDQAKALQRELAAIDVAVEEGGIKVVVRGDQKVKTIIMDGEEKPKLVEAINKAIKRAQDKAATRMEGMMGDLSGFLGK
jgi:DNA-binding protein YbaB